MSRNLIIYKVQYVLKSDPWDWGSANNKFIKIKRIVMPLSEYDDSGSRYRNHNYIQKQFYKQMGDNYSVWSIKKA